MKKLVMVQLALFTVSLALIIYKDAFPQGAFFWIFYLLAVLATFFIGMLGDKKTGLLSLIVLDIFIGLIFNVSYPLVFQMDRDSGFEAEYAAELTEEGWWNPGLGVGYAQNYYGYNPLLHFILAILSLTTGYDTYFLTKYILIYVLRMVFLLLAYLVFHELSGSKKTVFLALLLYIITPRLRIVYISRRFIAAILVLFFIYALLKRRSATQKLKWYLLLAVTSLLLVLADHSVPFLFLLFMLGWSIFALVSQTFYFKKKTYVGAFAVTLGYGLVYYAYKLLFTSRITAADDKYIQELIRFLTKGELLSSLSTATGTTYGSSHTYVYSFLETISAYASQLVILVIGGIAALFLLRKLYKSNIKDIRYADFFVYYSFFGLVSYVALLIMARTTLSDFYMVFIWFALLPSCLLVANFLLSFRLHILQRDVTPFLLLGVVIVVYIGGLLITYHPVVFSKQTRSNMVLEFIEYKNPRLYSSAKWLGREAEPGANVIGDKSIFDIFSGYFRMDVLPHFEVRAMYSLKGINFTKRFVFGTVWYPTNDDPDNREPVEYYIVNRDLYTYPSYLFGSPISPLNDQKFDSNTYLHKIYDNEKVAIYRNRWEKG